MARSRKVASTHGYLLLVLCSHLLLVDRRLLLPNLGNSAAGSSLGRHMGKAGRKVESRFLGCRQILSWLLTLYILACTCIQLEPSGASIAGLHRHTTLLRPKLLSSRDILFLISCTCYDRFVARASCTQNVSGLVDDRSDERIGSIWQPRAGL